MEGDDDAGEAERMETSPEKTTSMTTESGSDILSNLSDDTLIKILSSLNTKHAVKTSVLSKRWTNLWTGVTSINFNSNAFNNLKKFTQFVDHVLRTLNTQTTTKIDSLIFKLDGTTEMSLLDNLARYAFSHGVQHLTVSIRHGDRARGHGQEIPAALTSSDKLQTLKLKSKASIDGPYTAMKSMHFIQLTALHLTGIEFSSSDPFSECPNLKDLVIDNCFKQSVEQNFELNINAPQLSSLKINVFNLRSSRIVGPEFVVSTPNLTYLELLGFVDLSFQKSGELPVLDTVRLDLYRSNNLRKLLRWIANTETLSISSRTMQFFYEEDPDTLAQEPSPLLAQEPSPLRSLKILKFIPGRWLKSLVVVPSYVKKYLLQSSPFVEIVLEPGLETFIDELWYRDEEF